MCAVCAFAVGFSFLYGLNNINYADKKLTDAADYKCILNIWHIDTFEGGVGSRGEFLTRRAAEYEKTFTGVLTIVSPHTAESAAERLAAGECPDLISYGYGVELASMLPFTGMETFALGEYDGEAYALPWCRGSYALIVRDGADATAKRLEKAVVSKGEYTAPYAALALDGYTLGEYTEKPPFDAYYAFISGRADYLIGTQRDVNRLQSRNLSATVMPLTAYNDLYQYISLTARAEKRYYAEEYVKYLLSETAQKKLSAVGMSSCYLSVSYENVDLAALQRAQFNSGISVFMPRAAYAEFAKVAALAAKGDEAALEKIKKIVL